MFAALIAEYKGSLLHYNLEKMQRSAREKIEKTCNFITYYSIIQR